ncbi:MAG TPA: peptide deformylase [Spirochaetia bacterium]|nr:peptide deformylase [Spirochaetia bacterium]
MLSIYTLPDEMLRRSSEAIPDIDGEIEGLAEQMIEAMHAGNGIGLAGVQVGVTRRIFVVHVSRDKPRVFINPTIIETSVEESDYEEGCLSIPKVYADVRRPSAVRIQAWNERGRPFNLDADGTLARVILHEYDHLNGVLFIDHLSERKKEKLLREYDRMARV